MRAILGAVVVAWSTFSLAEIKWEVANGFPQFRNEADFQKLRSAWPESATAEQFLATVDAQRLRDLLPINSTLWNNVTGQYDKERFFQRQHEVVMRLVQPGEGSCTWYVNQERIAQEVPCKKSVRSRPLLEDEEFSIRVEHDGLVETPKETPKIVSHTILALGDSFASGEGNPDRASVLGTQPGGSTVVTRDWFLQPKFGNKRFSASAQWWDETCHRSLLSWQSLYAIEMAMRDTHRVVRFASYACSGAELYDGYFRAQTNPPGFGNVTRVRNTSNRDGGDVQSPASAPRLNRSQLNAAIDLLCQAPPTGEEHVQLRPEVPGLRQSPYFGEFTYHRCTADLHHVDEVLLTFGGNDFGFSSVVSWALVPSTARRGVLNPLRQMVLGWVRNSDAIRVIDPDDAGQMATKYTQAMYTDLNWSLQNVLRVHPKQVTMLVYPDPLPEKVTESCAARLSVGNVALSQVFMAEIKKRAYFYYQSKNFIFRVEKEDSVEVKTKFISKLQAAQRAAISQAGWRALESQEGFVSQDGMRSMCAVAPSCGKNGDCPVPDRFAWTYETPFLSEEVVEKVNQVIKDKRQATLDPKNMIWQDATGMPIKRIQEWEPYTTARLRGLRTSNDAVMTQAVFSANGLLSADWRAGVVHPVALVHASIADHLNNIERSSEKKTQQDHPVGTASIE